MFHELTHSSRVQKLSFDSKNIKECKEHDRHAETSVLIILDNMISVEVLIAFKIFFCCS